MWNSNVIAIEFESKQLIKIGLNVERKKDDRASWTALKGLTEMT
jgi:hypothetical protein